MVTSSNPSVISQLSTAFLIANAPAMAAAPTPNMPTPIPKEPPPMAVSKLEPPLIAPPNKLEAPLITLPFTNWSIIKSIPLVIAPFTKSAPVLIAVIIILSPSAKLVGIAPHISIAASFKVAFLRPSSTVKPVSVCLPCSAF